MVSDGGGIGEAVKAGVKDSDMDMAVCDRSFASISESRELWPSKYSTHLQLASRISSRVRLSYVGEMFPGLSSIGKILLVLIEVLWLSSDDLCTRISAEEDACSGTVSCVPSSVGILSTVPFRCAVPLSVVEV